ncbi:MAG: hypothetical protein AAF570_10960, partial [Bacteroidota bacterium]
MKLTKADFMMDYSPSQTTGAFGMTMQVGDAMGIVGGNLTDKLELTGTLIGVNVRKLFTQVTGGQTLPEEIPDMTIDMATVTLTPSTGAFDIVGSSKIKWDHLTNNGQGLQTQVSFTLGRSVTSPGNATYSCGIGLQGTGPVTLSEGVAIKDFNFVFQYDANGWQVGGGINLDLFGKKLFANASFISDANGKALSLQAVSNPEVNLIDYAGVGSFSMKSLDLKLRRILVNGKKQTNFELRVGSSISIAGSPKISGYLSLFKENGAPAPANPQTNSQESITALVMTGSGLVFQPTGNSASWTVDIPGGTNSKMSLRLFQIGFQKVNEKWGLNAVVQLGFQNFPGFISNVLPSNTWAKLVLSPTAVSLSALYVTDPVPVSLGNANGKSLGKMHLQIIEIGLNLKPDLGLTIEAGIGFPQELNTHLGGSVFRVYSPANPISMGRARVSFGPTGVGLDLISSPFAGANATVVNGEAWMDSDFGQYGAISFKMPTLIYDAVSQYFEAGSAIQIKRPLALPVKPLKDALVKAKLDAVAAVFPDKIPLEGIKLVDSNNNLKVNELITFLKKAGPVPKELEDVIRGASGLLNRFPSTFKSYFNLDIPSHIDFKFGFSPTGRVNVGFHAPKEPLRFLMPSIVQGIVPLPGLSGIELRKFTLGTIASGTLFVADVDAIVDQYDFPSLVASLMLPQDPSFPLPTSDELMRRFVLKNVFSIIPAAQGIPLPIPIFYDELGFESLGLEGVGLQAHVGLPRPNIAGLIGFVNTLKRFFAEKDYFLNPNTDPGLGLAFKLRDNYLKLPEYLGSSALGNKGSEKTLSLWSNLAKLMNFMKSQSIDDLVGAIPIQYRAGSGQKKFAFMNFNSDWLVT